MKIHVKTVWDMATMEIIEDECFDWCGPVAHCKGEDVAKQQLAQQNAAQQAAADQQKAIRDQVMGSINKYLTGSGEGFDPEQLALMQSQFLNQNAQNFNAANSQVLSSLRARGLGGGDQPAGGGTALGLEALQGARATSQSQGILGTNIANLQQALTNRFNAASVAGGQSAQLGTDIGIYGQGANNSLDQYIKAKNAPGFFQSLATSFAGGVGKGFADIATGGASSIFDSIGASFGRKG